MTITVTFGRFFFTGNIPFPHVTLGFFLFRIPNRTTVSSFKVCALCALRVVMLFPTVRWVAAKVALRCFEEEQQRVIRPWSRM